MELKIHNMDYNLNQRLIILSDIHGKVDLFKKALQKVKFTSHDICIIVGDLCERGERSLELIRYIIELQKTYHIYCVTGNCDTIVEDFLTEDEQSLKNYLLHRKYSLIKEMCDELNIEVNEYLDIRMLRELFSIYFKQEIDFLTNLPTIIETKSHIFVHAGIDVNLPLNKQNPLICVTMPSFMRQNVHFDKTVIVGHYPVCNYDKNINCNNVRYDFNKNIIGIDGGNTIKYWGQLNILIIENNQYLDTYVDDLSLIRALEYQPQGNERLNICYPNTKINILKQNDVNSECYLEAYDEIKTFLNSDIYFYKNEYYFNDTVINQMEINKDEIVSLVKKTDQGILIKKAGITGWYYGKYEKIQ